MKIGDSPKSSDMQMVVCADNLKETSQGKHMGVQLEKE